MNKTVKLYLKDDPDFVERKRRQTQMRADIASGKRQKREEGDCWFCLGGEHVRKHMVENHW